MTLGERSILTITPDYGYGDRSNPTKLDSRFRVALIRLTAGPLIRVGVPAVEAPGPSAFADLLNI
ncbi:hypothetical protein RJZ57_006988 [Blastomyces gilchristii]